MYSVGNINVVFIVRIYGRMECFLVIAHNLQADVLDTLSQLLWTDPVDPPLIAVRSAGFLADFYIQFHEHCGKLGSMRYASCVLNFLAVQ